MEARLLKKPFAEFVSCFGQTGDTKELAPEDFHWLDQNETNKIHFSIMTCMVIFSGALLLFVY